MSEKALPCRYDLLLRYRVIEIIAYWEGRLNANHLQSCFGIGRQQASKDINNYLKEFGQDNLEYNSSLKGYEPTPHFTPVVTLGEVDEYLHLINRNIDISSKFEGLPRGIECAHTMPLPTFKVRPEVLRPIIKACHQRERLEIDYRSVSAPDKNGRIIVPHSIVHSGLRWHVRAWCEKNQEYRDFVLTRFYGQPESIGKTLPLPPDTDWETKVNVCFKPDPRLSEDQQSIVANDYGMTNNRLVVCIRASLIPYLLKMLNLDAHKIEGDARAQQIVIGNLPHIQQWLFK